MSKRDGSRDSEFAQGAMRKFIILCLVICLLWIGAILFYYWNFKCDSTDPFTLCVPSTKEEWGQFGDYLGGLLNPIFASLTFILVLISVYLQRLELKTVSEEIFLLRKVQQDGLNRKHYEYILKKCSEENSDFKTNVNSFIDSFASLVKMTSRPKKTKSYSENMVSFFNLVANDSFQGFSLKDELEFEEALEATQKSLTPYIDSVKFYIQSISDQIEQLKALGCPRFMMEELLKTAEELTDDFYLSQSKVFNKNMKEYVVDLSVLNNLVNTYPDYP